LKPEEIRAARALLRWEQKDLAQASGISLPTIKRLETQPGQLAAQSRTIDDLRSPDIRRSCVSLLFRTCSQACPKKDP